MLGHFSSFLGITLQKEDMIFLPCTSECALSRAFICIFKSAVALLASRQINVCVSADVIRPSNIVGKQYY